MAEKDDITYCTHPCEMKRWCYRHFTQIKDRDVPHSYADLHGTGYCPISNLDKQKEKRRNK